MVRDDNDINTYFTIFAILLKIYFPAQIMFTGGAVDGLVKQWTPNVDFEAPRNWDAGHVPSPVDVAVFQKDTLVPVVVPAAGVDVCEVVLPFNGQLILEPNARVVISASSEAMGGCTGQGDYNLITILLSTILWSSIFDFTYPVLVHLYIEEQSSLPSLEQSCTQ